jgi:hypothetical protein
MTSSGSIGAAVREAPWFSGVDLEQDGAAVWEPRWVAGQGESLDACDDEDDGNVAWGITGKGVVATTPCVEWKGEWRGWGG